MPTKKLKAVQDLHQAPNLSNRRVPSKNQSCLEFGALLSAEEQFDCTVISYYASKSVEADRSSFDAIADNALQSEKLAQKILSMPAMTAPQVLAKLSILDAELLSDLDCEAPIDRRHIVAFATLKVDIVRLLAQIEK